MNFTAVNQTDDCFYYTCPERSLSTAVYVLLCMSLTSVVLVTVCGNLIIIISVCHFKQLHTPTNMLILSLAVSDFLIGVFVMPPALLQLIESCWIFTRVFCALYLLTGYFFTSVSIYNVALIAVDRYFALSNPFLYTKTVSVSIMCIVVLCNWGVWLSYNITLQYPNFKSIGRAVCSRGCFHVLNDVWSVVDILLSFVFPLSVIIILYTLVFFIAKKHVTAIRELKSHTRTQTSKNMTHSMKSERKAAKVLGILVSVFVACLLPYFLYSVLGSVVEIEEESLHKFFLLLYLNSAINPVIYALFYPWFRKSVKVILTLRILSTDSSLIHIL
ncbi:trace amine-associated receptor 13c-like [Electrophorus electricus]|uniref:G-protein coupled receptors family 1 profile domain-containing protein n=1 Tax=Electrophorus electricus TaxID=8005 RepID=A0AAY5EN21_ELEEL|nr:trace amine-associated receptor 13c-like [Electrophorus electricus]